MAVETRLNIDGAANEYYSRYKEHMQVLESHSPLSKIRTITPYDYYALGKQLDSFTAYKSICEEEGTVSQLGKLPDLAFDIITVN